MDTNSLVGRRALVTGATQGIGLAIARGFAKAGADVWVSGRDSLGLALQPEFGDRFVQADLNDPDGATSLAQAIVSRCDRLDILVNNAGVEKPMSVERLSLDALDETWRVNARAPVQLVSALLPMLKASGRASVINITSIHSTTPYAGNLAYCMSKAALEMATKVAAIELAPFGIRVNNLSPGAIETDINRDVLDRIGRQKFAEWIPSGRVGIVEEVVGPAIFLASDAASYVTGTTLCADGAYNLNLLRYRADELG